METKTRVVVVDPSDPDQVMELVGYDYGVSRRGFMQVLGAGVVIAVVAGGAWGQERSGGRRRGGGWGQAKAVPLDARLHVGADGVITVMTGKVEGGQGARAEISQAAAEELGVGVEKIALVMADTGVVPDDGITAGSRTTPGTLPGVRQACATARGMLVAMAAKEWGVEGKELGVKEGAVEYGGKKLTYADLVGAEGLGKVMPAGDVKLRGVGEWEVLGKAVRRPNGREVVTGGHKYPRDVKREGMGYGVVLRPPSYGAKLKGLKGEKVEGAVVVRDGEFVGVVGETSYAARKALRVVEAGAEWEERQGQASSAELAAYLRGHVREAVPGNPFAEEVKAAARVVRVTYTIPYVQHTPMEPRAAVAVWGADGRLTVWTSTQNPFGVRRELAGAFHVPEEKVRVVVPDFGGGFGGKHTGECAVEAARLARGAGRPVAVQWTRKEEFTWAYFRPAAVIDAEVSVDGSGGVTSWHFVNINSGPQGVETPYRVGKANCRHVPCDAPMRHGSYRALASTANHFARESLMDELAVGAGRDPVEYRLGMLDDQRLREVLQTAAEKFGWEERRAGRKRGTGVGVACGTEKGSFVGTCAEVEVADGEVRVTRLVQAFDCGKVTNPLNLVSQNQGAMVQALGPVLREATEFEGGRVTNATLFEYRVPRVGDVPGVLEVHLIDRPEVASAGAGETPLICVAPAVANAVFAATGVRVRDLPIRVSASA